MTNLINIIDLNECPYHVRREVVAVGEVSVAEVAGVHHLPVGRAGHPPDGQAVGKVLLLVRFQT